MVKCAVEMNEGKVILCQCLSNRFLWHQETWKKPLSYCLIPFYSFSGNDVTAWLDLTADLTSNRHPQRLFIDTLLATPVTKPGLWNTNARIGGGRSHDGKQNFTEPRHYICTPSKYWLREKNLWAKSPFAYSVVVPVCLQAILINYYFILLK